MIELNISDFLLCSTPDEWVSMALQNQDILLIDHAHCEKKAASTALSLMFRYVDRASLLPFLSRLAREELRHFEQVLSWLNKKNIHYKHLSPARYAGRLREHMRKSEPHRLIDHLIIAAFIEARSCERFTKIAPHLDSDLSSFYTRLCESEARHFGGYITMAREFALEEIDERVQFFAEVEKTLIISRDIEFRFHSGLPVE